MFNNRTAPVITIILKGFKRGGGGDKKNFF